MQINWARKPHPFATVTLGTGILFILLAVNAASTTTAQKTSATITTAPTAVANFTKLLSQNTEFQQCYPSQASNTPAQCFPTVDVLFQSPLTLVFKSNSLDTIWKAVDLAKKQGYKIDAISTYIPSPLDGGTVNTLVAMSRG